MSDSHAAPARPVSLFTIGLLLVVFAAFLVVVRYLYTPASEAPYNAAAENLPKDLAWRATAELRRKALIEQREKEAKQATSYAWVDQKAGVVQLPVDRAMELTVQHYRAKK